MPPGKILIQRDESSEDKHPVMYYSKLPPKVEEFDRVLLVDPMLATGGSVNMAIKVRALARLMHCSSSYRTR
jgi:uracil phosphoribosyltransferase